MGPTANRDRSPKPQLNSPKEHRLALVWLALYASLYLPFFNESLGDVRWIIFCVIAVGWLLGNTQWVSSTVVSGPLWTLVIAAVAIRLASATWSPMPIYTILRSVSLALMCLFLIAFITRIGTHSQLRVIGRLCVIVAVVFLLTGVILWLLGRSSVPLTGARMWVAGRFCGVLGGPNQLGIVAAICLPVVCSLWWEDKRRRAGMLLLTIVCLLSIIMAGSRGGVLGAVAGLSIFLGVVHSVRWFPIVAVLLVVAAVFLSDVEVVRQGVYEFATRQEYDPNSESELTIEEVGRNRLAQWRPGWESIQKRHLLGQGYGVGGTGQTLPGGFDYGYPLHNSYLQMWQENGIVGMLPVLGIILMVVFSLLELSLYTGYIPERVLWAGVAGTASVGIVSSVFESWLLSLGNLATLPIWSCLLAIVCHGRWRYPTITKGGCVR